MLGEAEMASPFFSFLGSTCDLLNRVVMLLRYSGISNIMKKMLSLICAADCWKDSAPAFWPGSKGKGDVVLERE